MFILKVMVSFLLVFIGWVSFDIFRSAVRLLWEERTTPVKHGESDIPWMFVTLIIPLIVTGVCWGVAFILLKHLLGLIGIL